MTTPNDDTVDKQDQHEALIRQELAAEDSSDRARFAKRGTSTIAAPTAPGATYDASVAASSVAAINAIRAALTAAGITA